MGQFLAHYTFHSYVLVKYDEHYPAMMSALGVPSIAMPFVLGASERLSYIKNGDLELSVTVFPFKLT